MDIALKRALVAAARAFADELERGMGEESGHPVAGSSQSMLEVLRSVAKINDEQTRGASDEEMREIARRAGMDPRGMAGYYAAGLLEMREDGSRWVTPSGRNRMQRLSALGDILLIKGGASHGETT